MPHISVEYSANLGEALEMGELCSKLLAAATATRLFELGAIRVRAMRADAYAIADRDSRNAFLHITFQIGSGRSYEQKRSAGDAVFSAAVTFADDLLGAGHCAVSLVLSEMDERLSWKKNAILARLRGRASAGAGG
ncbi:MAG: 5-carboxymethyl-2-hydroxymuconate isomerase [Parvibaculaceae bacterium]